MEIWGSHASLPPAYVIDSRAAVELSPLDRLGFRTVAQEDLVLQMANILKLVDPSLSLVALVPKSELNEFLGQRGLVVRHTGIQGQRVVFDQKYVPLVDGSPGDRVTVLRSLENLAQRISKVLDKDRVALFAPRMLDMRHFFSVAVFAQAMNRLVQEIDQAEIAVPPGLYGQSRYRVAVQRRPSADQAQTNDQDDSAV